MKVYVDSTRCSGYGACADICPSMFSLDEWGYAAVVTEVVPDAALEPQVRAAVAECPENAIRCEE